MLHVQLAGVAVAFLLFASPAVAHPDAAHPWDATWAGGFEGGGQGVQIIVVGNEVIGLFYAGDYVDVSESEPLASDGSLVFKWQGGDGRLLQDGDVRELSLLKSGASTPEIFKITEDN